MKVTIAIMAGRANPRIDWILDDVVHQMRKGDEIDMLVVDGCYAHELPREHSYRGDAALSMRHVRPKPTIWQGPHRITREDFWAKSSAANTALVLARHEYIAFLDDCCHLAPTWLDAVRQGERDHRVIAGSYSKREGGQTTTDTRLGIAPHGKIDCGGAWLYGGTFALPLAVALSVNGFEEGCDGLGGEDCIFGLMLGNAKHRIDFVPELAIVQQRDDVSDGSGGAFPRKDKIRRSENFEYIKSRAAIARFGSRRRTEFTPDLTRLRARIACGETFPVPSPVVDYRDWFDDEPISEMQR